ncbi:MAG TPA: proline dehydrogenase family protein [Terriglobia bacterium]|nr:proline dehydrogenase family protein [Terriglobia bacterium]
MPGMMRGALLWASRNNWLRERAARYRFVRRSVSRFMPGEQIADVLAAARTLEGQGLDTVLTHLGENVSTAEEAASVTSHYLDALVQARAAGLGSEFSVKLTHLGLDLSHELCQANVEKLIQAAGPASIVWIDMESSPYVDATLDLYRNLRRAYANVGVCLQAYLYRTADDLASLLPMGPAIRLVKGAYLESAKVAFPRKKDVDENYFALATKLLSKEARNIGVRTVIATHDLALIHRVERLARAENLTAADFQFVMLYGIQRAEQLRLARDGWRSGVLISYGTFWFPWYMRRLAERPANIGFVIRNLLGG